MEDLNALLEAELFKAVKGKGNPIVFSKEDLAKSEASFREFAKSTGKMESMVRQARALAASSPDTYLTC